DQAMDLIYQFGREALDVGILEVRLADLNNMLASCSNEGLHKIKESLVGMAQRADLNINWLAIGSLFQRPWFSRVWVVQEVAVSREVVFACGEKRVPFTYLAAGIP